MTFHLNRVISDSQWYLINVYLINDVEDVVVLLAKKQFNFLRYFQSKKSANNFFVNVYKITIS